MAKSVFQPVESSVDPYIQEISEEQNNVDAVVRLIDAESRFCNFSYETHQMSSDDNLIDVQNIGDGVQIVQQGLQQLTTSTQCHLIANFQMCDHYM